MRLGPGPVPSLPRWLLRRPGPATVCPLVTVECILEDSSRTTHHLPSTTTPPSPLPSPPLVRTRTSTRSWPCHLLLPLPLPTRTRAGSTSNTRARDSSSLQSSPPRSGPSTTPYNGMFKLLTRERWRNIYQDKFQVILMKTKLSNVRKFEAETSQSTSRSHSVSAGQICKHSGQ